MTTVGARVREELVLLVEVLREIKVRFALKP